MIKSFPKIWALGHINIQSIFDNEVEITEKIDGSQFCFGFDSEGKYHCRSKGTMIDLNNVPHLFQPVVEWSSKISPPVSDIVYYGETLCKPKHNTLQYDRVPNNNFVLFGISNFSGDIFYPYHSELEIAATLLGCDVVPLLHQGKADFSLVQKLMQGESFLGGAEAEGVVVKAYTPYELYGSHVPVMCGKFVTEKFKEEHSKNPEYVSGKTKIQGLTQAYKTEARWLKAVQHLRDNGELLGEPKDIGNLMKEISRDFEEECKEQVKEQLWDMYRKDFLKVIVNGAPQWYKEELAKGNINLT